MKNMTIRPTVSVARDCYQITSLVTMTMTMTMTMSDGSENACGLMPCFAWQYLSFDDL